MSEENGVLDNPDIEDPDALPPEIPTDEHIFAYTHHQRKRIIKSITKRGIPEDPEYQKVLLTTLKDMDTSALGRKRIKVDEKLTSSQTQAASIISDILNKMQGVKLHVSNANANTPAPVLPAHIPDPVLVPGETSTSSKLQSVEVFLAENGGEDQN